MTNAKTVLDTSMGWGDRLAGFFASDATHYIGCDPNPNTFKVYWEMVREFDKLAPDGTLNEQILMKFQDYFISSSNVTVPDDKGPITIEATVMPRALNSCTVRTHWILQG